MDLSVKSDGKSWNDGMSQNDEDGVILKGTGGCVALPLSKESWLWLRLTAGTNAKHSDKQILHEAPWQGPIRTKRISHFCPDRGALYIQDER